MEKTAQPRPFGLRDKIGYLFGDFGNDFTFILSTVILSKFYTDVMGVSAGVVGTVMMLARAVDAVTDLSMGRLCDRSRPTPVGKFKPWLLRLCVPVAAASFLLYQSGFAGRPMGFKICLLYTSAKFSSVMPPVGSSCSPGNGPWSARIAAGPPDWAAGKNFTTPSPSRCAACNSVAVTAPG